MFITVTCRHTELTSSPGLVRFLPFLPAFRLASRVLSVDRSLVLSVLVLSRYVDSAHANWVALKLKIKMSKS